MGGGAEVQLGSHVVEEGLGEAEREKNYFHQRQIISNVINRAERYSIPGWRL